MKIYLFDCLFYEGIDLTGLPLIDRKDVLRDVVRFDDTIVFTPHRSKGAAAMLRQACARGEEGVIAKLAESHYLSGRSAAWLKIKCVHRQEFVIGGSPHLAGTAWEEGRKGAATGRPVPLLTQYLIDRCA